MTTFVVVAAGRGSRLGRVGDALHKCLVPIDGQAILSRQFALAPPDAKLIVVTGYRAEQIRNFVQLAHPNLEVTFVHDDQWGNGPGASLLRANQTVTQDEDMVWAACDTLWERADDMWNTDVSWLGVAPIPAGTPAARWCRVVPNGTYVQRIDDKTPDVAPGSVASVALGYVVADDLSTFWQGLDDAETRAGEVQFSSGLDAILASGRPLATWHVNWLDVGDEAAYRAAQATYGTYDPVKPGQATYVVPESGRVVKFNADPNKITGRILRARAMEGAVPKLVDDPSAEDMVAYEYVDGQIAYDAMIDATSSPTHVTTRVLDWWSDAFWSTCNDAEPPYNWYDVVMRFYRDKTFARVMALPRELQTVALDAVTRVDWHALVEGNVPGTFHGDFTYANIIVANNGSAGNLQLTGIDWREDFGDELTCADLRYDLGKLLGSTQFHWAHATEGNFRHWEYGDACARCIRRFVCAVELDVRDIEIIAALTLINSAPLHATPMDEILVTRGARWLGQVT